MIQRYWDDDLTEMEQEKMNKHLENCKECQSFYERIQNVHLGLASLPKVNLPYSLVDTILPKIDQLAQESNKVKQDQEKVQKRKGIAISKRWQIFSAVAASVLIILLVNQWMMSSTKQDMLMENVAVHNHEETMPIEDQGLSVMSTAGNAAEIADTQPEIFNAEELILDQSSTKMMVTAPQFTMAAEEIISILSPDEQYIVHNFGTTLEIYHVDGEMVYQLSLGEDQRLVDLLWIDEQRLQYHIQYGDQVEVWILDVTSGKIEKQ